MHLTLRLPLSGYLALIGAWAEYETDFPPEL